MRLVRSVGAEWAIWRLIGAGRETLSQAALGRGRQDRGRFAALMLDRIGLIAPRLAAVEPGSAVRTVDVLAGLRVGLNIVDIRRARRALPPSVLGPVDTLLDALGQHYRGRRRPPAPSLLPCLDEALCAIASLEEGLAKRDALIGLVGIRRGLFPDAPPYQAERPLEPRPELAAA
jgi:hypothetical protein